MSSESTPSDLPAGFESAPEVREPVSLSVTGTLPPYLHGCRLYRVGPGRYDVNHSDKRPMRIEHWFDGISLLHSFTLDAESNAVSYRNRFLADDYVSAVEETPSARWTAVSFGTPADPCRGFLGRLFQLAVGTGAVPTHPATGKRAKPNIGVTLQTVPGKGVAIRSDMAFNHVLDEEALEAGEFFTFSSLRRDDKDFRGTASAAHGHYDPNTREFFNYIYDYGPGDAAYSVFSVSENGTDVLATVRDKHCYVHAVTATDRYVILMVWPMIVDSKSMLWTRSILEASHFDPVVDTKFYVVDRHDGKGVVATFTAPAFFAFHVVNAYDDGDDVIIDLSRYNDGTVLHDLKLARLRSPDLQRFAPSTLTRYTLRAVSEVSATAVAHESLLSDADFELPRINAAFKQRTYQFTYGVGSEHAPFDTIAKVDVKTGQRLTWSRDRCIVGEPIFVASPDGTEEEDGCLLVVVLDAATKTSDMVVLDASSMQTIATAHVPQAVPLGFHGMVVQQEALALES